MKIPLFLCWLGRRRSIGALVRRGAPRASAVPFGGVSGARIHSPHGGLPGSPCLFGLVPDTIAFWQKPDLGTNVLRVARFAEYLRKNRKTVNLATPCHGFIDAPPRSGLVLLLLLLLLLLLSSAAAAPPAGAAPSKRGGKSCINVGLIWTWFIHRGIFQLHVWLPRFRGDEKCIAGDIRELIPKRPLQSLTLQSALSYAASWCLNFSGNLLHRVSQQLVRKWLVLFNFTRNNPRLCCEADLVSNTFLNQARFALKAAGWPRRGRSGWWSDIYLSLYILYIYLYSVEYCHWTFLLRVKNQHPNPSGWKAAHAKSMVVCPGPSHVLQNGWWSRAIPTIFGHHMAGRHVETLPTGSNPVQKTHPPWNCPFSQCTLGW